MSRSKCKSSGDVADTAQKYQVITRETKMKIIERMEHAEKIVDTAGSYDMNCSTIGMILKNKEHVKSAAPKMSTVTSKKRAKVEKMEEFVSVYMWDQRQVPLRESPLSPPSILPEDYGKVSSE